MSLLRNYLLQELFYTAESFMAKGKKIKSVFALSCSKITYSKLTINHSLSLNFKFLLCEI